MQVSRAFDSGSTAEVHAANVEACACRRIFLQVCTWVSNVIAIRTQPGPTQKLICYLAAISLNTLGRSSCRILSHRRAEFPLSAPGMNGILAFTGIPPQRHHHHILLPVKWATCTETRSAVPATGGRLRQGDFPGRFCVPKRH